MTPRDVIVSVPPHTEGKPHVVRLTHRPSGRSVEGQGESYEQARAVAQEALEREVAVVEAAGGAPMGQA